MSLTTAQKHDLIIKFNQDRQGMYEDYVTDKQQRKEARNPGSNEEVKDESGSQYKKLYKHLGNDNRNKDVRKQLQGEIDMYTDNQLSTNLHVNHIPGYSMDKFNQVSSFKDTFQGKVEEPVDKIYFRQKDEINQYAEAYVKSMIILQGRNGKPENPTKK
uniref:Uncharacterized protein n=1 Tax=Strombidium inclinatum TaxID=197538 RepID=A0A7S3IJ96_9SPIT|mmetsp:Transcript_22402/g.34659  ORF Transcript_22402/g.34659 Transcript_22402/m.34659 type:complete len:159 (+) Transcript_22402:34-510(+)|eukprot:CAMPEP_0170481040 /NCGR_PEP_ID=MMETSP0208-20121228/1639_1 /TAXON_ID=197538 /ORGANISM="Strombidium inclinatum, Strain S3" /LENGTH=158 /DNA_ID=CAMNT_0010753675 /DNA_START=18 /DNA_END=494 /DNA_ORIENTATION=-